MRNVAIITAAGSGTRMKTAEKKQFLMLSGKPILAYTIIPFIEARCFDTILITAPELELEKMHDLVATYCPNDSALIRVIPGGNTRQKSVQNALEYCDKSTKMVAIHDGVRPFVTTDEICFTMKMAEKYGAAILGSPAVNTIKSVNKEHKVQHTLLRNELWEIYTPQCFRYEIIYPAHHQAHIENAHDDAELLERMNTEIHVVSGRSTNIKITTSADLELAEYLLTRRRNEKFFD